MVRRKKTSKVTPGIVAPTPMTADGAYQAGPRGYQSFAQPSDQDKARRLKPTGFFGSEMPRTAILAKAPPAHGGGRHGGADDVPAVEAPADPSLAPVTIADINEGAVVPHCCAIQTMLGSVAHPATDAICAKLV
jgi:hypothetical protein